MTIKSLKTFHIRTFYLTKQYLRGILYNRRYLDGGKWTPRAVTCVDREQGHAIIITVLNIVILLQKADHICWNAHYIAFNGFKEQKATILQLQFINTTHLHFFSIVLITLSVWLMLDVFLWKNTFDGICCVSQFKLDVYMHTWLYAKRLAVVYRAMDVILFLIIGWERHCHSSCLSSSVQCSLYRQYFYLPPIWNSPLFVWGALFAWLIRIMHFLSTKRIQHVYIM